MQIIALINQKGGVGKTTCAVNIGAGLNKLKKRVLLIDLDPQAHLTYKLGIPTARGSKWHFRTIKYILENFLHKGMTHYKENNVKNKDLALVLNRMLY